jgi:hypothetical protein
MVEPPGDAAQIADAIPAGILKGARVNLINDTTLPPRHFHFGHSSQM